MKKYLSAFVISALFALSIFLPVYCSAEETCMNNGFVINDKNEITDYTGSEAHIVIPDGITSIKEQAFEFNNNILSVTIPASVTSIDSFAFAYCPNLTRVSIGGELVKMGYGVFNGTPWRKSQTDEYVVLAGTLIAYNGKGTSLKVPAGTKYVTGGLFSEYKQGNDYLSYGRKITSVTLPNGLLGIIDEAFSGCINLKSITIPDSVTYIGSLAFEGCSALRHVTLPANLEIIGARAFDGCSSLEFINIPDGTRIIGNSFVDCTALKSVVIPDSVTILDAAFYNCTALEKVTLSNSLSLLLPNTFERTKWFEENTDEFLVSGGVLVKYSGKGGTVVLPKGIRIIGDGVFLENDLIESVYITDGVEYVGDSNFAYCDNLKLVYVPGSVNSIHRVKADTTRYWHWGGYPPPPFLGSHNVTIYGSANSAVQCYHSIMSSNGMDVGKFVVSDGLDLNIPDAPELTTEDLKASAAHSSIESPQEGVQNEPTVDEPSSWAVNDLKRAIALGLVPENLNRGYVQTITRSEFCALAVTVYEKIKGNAIEERIKFNDTNDVNIQKMGALGVVTGVGNGNFSPDAFLTREQAATMLSRLSDVLGKPLNKKEATFTDKSTISKWALDQVGQVQVAGIMGSTGNNNFSPKGNYTREQSIITIIRIYDMLIRGN